MQICQPGYEFSAWASKDDEHAIYASWNLIDSVAELPVVSV
jgi:hypothetical protein